jgi:hypothetical protein
VIKAALKRLIRDESGRALLYALILLGVGGLIIPPTLAYMGTGVITGEVYNTKTEELYAADAGVEDAVWKIESNDGYLPCNPSMPPRTYNISDVNGKSVDVTIIYVYNVTGVLTYKINSIAATDSDSNTTIESLVEQSTPGELNIFDGILSSKDDIDFISFGSTITGNIYYGGTLDPNFTHISGNETHVTSADFPTAAQDLAFAQALKAAAIVGGNHTGDMTISSNIILNSTYISGNLNIDSSFTLAGIVYVKGSISASKEITITGSGSPIALVAEGDISFEKVGTAGNTSNFIIMSLSSSGINFKKEATVGALVYAPNGPIYFNKNADIDGGIVGASITVKKDASLTYIQKASGFDLPGKLPGTVKIKTYSINPWPA